MKIQNLIPKPRTKFLKIKCSGCGNEQIVFSAATRKIKCTACENLLVTPTGSKALINSEKFEELR